MKKSKIIASWIISLSTFTAVTVPFINPIMSSKNITKSATESPKVGDADSVLGKSFTATELSALVEKNYPDHKITIPDSSQPVDNNFTQMEEKWPQEFITGVSEKIAVYSKFAKEVFLQMIAQHPSDFIDGLPAEKTSLAVGSELTSPILEASSPNNGTLTFKFRLTIEGFYTGVLEIPIVDMKHQKTVINVAGLKDFSITPDSGLTPYIVSDFIKKDPTAMAALTAFLQKNIFKIFENIPLTTKIEKCEAERVAGSDTSISLKVYVDKYSDIYGNLNPWTVPFPDPDSADKIILGGFAKPNALATPKPIDQAVLNGITGIASTNPWYNIGSKYANDFVTHQAEFLPEIEKLINNNKDVFFNNPVSDDKNTAHHFPIVKNDPTKPLKLSLYKENSSTDYGKLKLSGWFLSNPENNNNELDTSCYLPMEFIISGFDTNPTNVVSAGLSVQSDPVLKNLIPEQAKLPKYKSNLENFILNQIEAGNVFGSTIYKTRVTVNNTMNDVTVIDGDPTSVNVKFTSSVAYGVGGAPNPDYSYTVKLINFTSPNTNITKGKTTSIIDVANESGSLILKGLVDSFAQEIAPEFSPDYNSVCDELKNVLNNKPEILLDNPITPDKNPSNLPIVKTGQELIIESAKDENGKFTHLNIKADLLCKPNNPNDNATTSDYKQLTITLTGFKQGRTEAQTTEILRAGPEIKNILVEDAAQEQNAKKIQQFIEKNVSKLLANTIRGKTTVSIKLNPSGQYMIKPRSGDESGIAITLDVTNYINSNCEIIMGKSTTMEAYMTGFAASNNNLTEGKKTTTILVSNLATGQTTGDFSIMMSLNEQMATDFVSTGNKIKVETRGGWGPKGVPFMRSLIKLINADPSVFFNNPVLDTKQPYVKLNNPQWIDDSVSDSALPKDNPPLTIETFDENMTKLKVTGMFLSRPAIIGNPPTYEEKSFIIEDFNRARTEANPDGYSIEGKNEYSITNSAGKKEFLYDLTVSDFLSTNGSGSLTKKILDENIRLALLNTSYDTYIKSYTTPSLNSADPEHRSLSCPITVIYSSMGNGKLTSTEKQFVVTIGGFKKPTANTEFTAVKNNITADTIVHAFDGQANVQYDYLSQLGKYYYVEFDQTQGYLNGEFTSEVISYINQFPEKFFDYPADNISGTSNPLKLPYVRFDKTTNSYNINVTCKINPENNIPTIFIEGEFLTRPAEIGIPLKESDYKPFTIKIANGVEYNFADGHKTELRTNKDGTFVYDLNDPVFIKKQLIDSYTLDTLSNDPDSIRNDLTEFVVENKDILFENVLKETKVESASIDPSTDIDFTNKQVVVNVNLSGIVTSNGIFQPDTLMTSQFFLKGFKEAEVIQNDSSNQSLLKSIAIAGCAGVVVLFAVFVFLTINSKRKKNNASDVQFDNFY